MDNKALFNLQYGVFILGTQSNGKINACVTNTCMQVANDPVRIAISVINTNLTCQMIKDSGGFTLSVLDKKATFERSLSKSLFYLFHLLESFCSSHGFGLFF